MKWEKCEFSMGSRIVKYWRTENGYEIELDKGQDYKYRLTFKGLYTEYLGNFKNLKDAKTDAYNHMLSH